MYYEDDYKFELTAWEVSIELEAYARKEKRRFEKTGEITTQGGWRSDSYGSAYCAESSFADIFAAYNDHRATKMAMGLYDNYCCY